MVIDVSPHYHSPIPDWVMGPSATLTRIIRIQGPPLVSTHSPRPWGCKRQPPVLAVAMLWLIAKWWMEAAKIILPKNEGIIVPNGLAAIPSLRPPSALARRPSPLHSSLMTEPQSPTPALAEPSAEVLAVPTPEPPAPTPPPRKTGGMRSITHDAIIDFVLSNPRATRKQIAEAFGYKSEQSISILINSDSFQARLQARREDLIDPLILGNVQDRIKGLADRSIEILEKKLEASADGNFALKVLEVTQRSQDYGAKPNGGVQTQFVVNLPGPAASSSEWMSKFAPADATVLRPDPSALPSE